MHRGRAGPGALGASTRSSECSSESPCGCLLHGIAISGRPIVRIHGQQRRLSQESRSLSLVRLRSVHQERMTQVHRARVAGGGDDRAVRAPRESINSQFPQRQPLVSCRSQLPGDVRV